MDFYKIIGDLMEEVVKKYKKKPALSEEQAKFLDKLIGMIELVAKSSYCDGVDLSITDKGDELIVSYFGQDIEIQNGRDNPFYRFAEMAHCVDISSEDDTVHVAFTFFGIWELKSIE